jgi:hypothetical protein
MLISNNWYMILPEILTAVAADARLTQTEAGAGPNHRDLPRAGGPQQVRPSRATSQSSHDGIRDTKACFGANHPPP